jgi:hypothetical protein
MASEQAGDIAAATAGYVDFLTAWKSADSDLPQLAHARAYLSSHNGVTASERRDSHSIWACSTANTVPGVSSANRKLSRNGLVGSAELGSSDADKVNSLRPNPPASDRIAFA